MARRDKPGGSADAPAGEPGSLTTTLVAVVLFLWLAGLGALIVHGVSTGFGLASAFGWAGQVAVALFVLLFGRRPGAGRR